MSGDRTAVIDERERRLAGHAVVGPYGAVAVDGMFEPADAECVDKVDDFRVVCPPGNADDGDTVTECLLNLCDRRGFASTLWSPGCPEPQHRVSALKRREVDLASADGRSCQPGGLGRRFGCDDFGSVRLGHC